MADLDASAINTNYALEAGLNPIKDPIAIEGNDSPYANVIVTRTQDKDAPWVKTLVESYHDDAIREFIETKYEGSVLPVSKFLNNPAIIHKNCARARIRARALLLCAGICTI